MKDRNTSTFKTRQEMANELGICAKTLRRKIKSSGLNISPGLLNLKEQKMIYNLIVKNGTDLSHHNRNDNVS